MDKKTVFIKTTKGEQESSNLSSDLKRILSLIDNKSRADDLAKRAPPSLRAGWMDFLGELVEGGYIRDKNAPSAAGPKIAVPKSSLLKMFSHKPEQEPELEELDYNSGYVAPAPIAAATAAKQKAEEAARIRAEMEAAVAAAKIRASADALAKAEAKAKQDAEHAAHAKALAEAEAASKAEYHAKKEAESAARAKAAAEAQAKQEAALRAQAEAKAKAKQEEALRLQEQQEAARAKAKLEEAIRVRAEIEAAARAQQVAEAKAKQEMAARMKAEQEAAQAKAALEAAAKAKIEEAARVRAEIEAAALARRLAEENARREAEAARLKAEQEVARVRAELEAAAKAKAEEEARVRAEIEAAALAQRQAEENARREAEAARLKAEENARREAEAARLKAEQEALRIKAELEAAKARAEAEAKALAEVLARQAAEETARQEAVAARARAEQAAARLRAEQEVEARIRAEADIKAAEALARQHAAEAAARREADELAIRTAELAASTRIAQGSTPVAPAARSFEINLDGFLSEETQDAVPAGQYVKKAGAGDEVRAKAEEVRSSAAEVKTTDEINSMHGVAAEMARLKSEAEAARRKLEEEARRQAEEKALAEEQSRAWEEAEQRAKVQAVLEIEQAAQQAAVSQAKATPKPVVRKHRKPLPLRKIAFTLMALAVIGVLVLPYVYPLQEYIAPLERQLSARLKQPVHIGGMSATSLPPRLKLRNVTVGSAQEVKAGTINLNFDLLSLFSGVKAISNAEIEDVSIQGNQLDKQAAKFKTLGSDAQYPVRHLTLQRVKILTDEIAMPVMSGVADMDAQGAFSRIALHSADDKLSFDLQPNQGRWQLGVNLKAGSLPILPEIVFDDFSAKGDLGDSEVNFSEMDAHMYSGILLGKARLSWSKGWQLQGSLEAKLFDLDKFFPKYHIEGEMYGEGNFSMTGARLSQMDDSPHLDGSFSVKKGLVNIDMVETARLMSRENLVGGRTRYDDLIGLVILDNHVLHLHQLRIASGALSASGQFDISPSSQLSGNFNAEIKMREGNNPLTLYGTLVEPKLRAGR